MTKPRCQTSRPRRPSRKMTSRGEMVVTLFDRVASAGMCHGYEKPRSTALNCNNASAVSTSLIQHASLSPNSLSLSHTQTHTRCTEMDSVKARTTRNTKSGEYTKRGRREGRAAKEKQRNRFLFNASTSTMSTLLYRRFPRE